MVAFFFLSRLHYYLQNIWFCSVQWYLLASIWNTACAVLFQRIYIRSLTSRLLKIIYIVLICLIKIRQPCFKVACVAGRSNNRNIKFKRFRVLSSGDREILSGYNRVWGRRYDETELPWSTNDSWKKFSLKNFEQAFPTIQSQPSRDEKNAMRSVIRGKSFSKNISFSRYTRDSIVSTLFSLISDTKSS